MTNAKLYLVIGVLIGVVSVLLIGTFPAEPVMAQRGSYQSSGPANGFIALTSIDRNQDVILWLIDTNRKNLLTYQLAYNPARAKLTAIRDIQYDLDVPDGVYYPRKKRGAEPTPEAIKKMMKDIKDKMKR